jgi:hypothetical protein
MRDGLYHVEFATPLGHGHGVVHLTNGMVRGGDSSMYYIGQFSEDGEHVSGEVSTDRHNPDPNFQNVFGRDKVRLVLSGRNAGDRIELTGHAKEAPDIKFNAYLTKLTD